jgi:nitric oxide reductase activation protein
MNIMGIKKTRREDWTDEHYGPWHELRTGSDVPVISEAILTSALQRLRLAFQDNMKASYDRNLKSGRVDRRALGKRIATNDPRLFHRKSIPSKKDYFVVVGMDCSGSTARALDRGNSSVRIIDLIKEATFAKCELLNRLGVKFAVYGHSGDSGYCAIYEVKSPEEPWGKKQKESLATLQPTSANLDGHTMEFYRKVAQVRPETDKIILYYTDGAMPLSNFDEELAILQREIKMCQRLGIAIVGVGIRNDDPKAHGLDTIRLDAIEDVPKVVTELRKRLLSTLIPN